MSYMTCDDGVMRPSTPQEIADATALAAAAAIPQVPQNVTSFQAKAALLNANLYDSVNTYMTSTATAIDRLAWQEQITFSRGDSIIANLMTPLNLTSVQLDELFTAAAQINP